ncbi:hypothetical protein [Microbispora hainanensis]|uniref:Uncharacterized protein n=1 Tax=Microbispora hainanensis TaxID=568844 RepID=A0A544YMN9_9ACTN|nr:hypothetical protein [Microbispora hainanensis]TQS18061.1 hypothetical protein FLX08_26625 [Microbispora hainanensis]
MTTGDSRELPGWLGGLATLVALVAGAWGLWCTVIGFTGGVLPVPFIEVEVSGGLATGLLMLFIGEPILMTLAYWAFMLVFVPLGLLFARRPA